MKVLYGEGLVNHAGLESCVVTRKGTIEALTEDMWAELLSREKTNSRVPTSSRVRKATMNGALTTSSGHTLRGRESWARI